MTRKRTLTPYSQAIGEIEAAFEASDFEGWQAGLEKLAPISFIEAATRAARGCTDGSPFLEKAIRVYKNLLRRHIATDPEYVIQKTTSDIFYAGGGNLALVDAAVIIVLAVCREIDPDRAFDVLQGVSRDLSGDPQRRAPVLQAIAKLRETPAGGRDLKKLLPRANKAIAGASPSWDPI